jgi:hypothetical protein
MIILINREKKFSNILSNEEDSKRKKFLKAALAGPAVGEVGDRDIPYNFIGIIPHKLLAKTGKYIGNEKMIDIGIKGMARSKANIKTAISNDEKKRYEIYNKSLDTYKKKYLSEN